MSGFLLSCAVAACGGSSDDGSKKGSDAGASGSATGGGGGGSAAVDRPSAAHTVAGIVTDVEKGSRIAGAKVTLVGSDVSTTTDANGAFSLPDLPEGVVSLSIDKSGYAAGYAATTSAEDAQAALVSLKKLGEEHNYDPSEPATLTETTDNGPYAVIFTPDSLDTSDTQLTVTVTPVDPTREDAALPGDLIAGGATPNPLQAVTFAEFSIWDSGGKRVNLKSSASAIVELPIPISLRADFPLDSKIHCYSYDASTAKWDDFVEGTVSTSTVDHVTPVLRASIRHFSWYGGAPAIEEQECAVVQVFSKVTGKPLAGATVSARPGLKAVTNSEGVASITVQKGTSVKYTATKTYTDTYVDDAGNLIPQQGSKVIEFGRVDQDDLLVPLITGPCPESGANSSKPAVKLETAPLPSGAFVYEITAVLSDGATSVIVQKGLPDEDGTIEDPEPVGGSRVVLHVEGGSDITLPSYASMLPAGVGNSSLDGFYTSPSGTTIPADGGQRYTLTVDVDGNGSIDATGNCVVPGTLSWTVPQSGASYAAADFTASWTDSASGKSGYNPQYYISFVSDEDGYGGAYIGSDLTYQPSPELKPGSYTATLQTLYSTSMFTGVSVQGQLLCGAGSATEISFSIE